MQMIRTLVMGAGAAGAAGVAIIAQPDGNLEQRGAADGANEICLKNELTLFEGATAKCYSREDLNALGDSPVVDMQGRPVTLSMAHPTDMSIAPADCRTCRDFGEMSFDGWYAMSSRDMRREAYFVRACGTLAALKNAQLAKTSFFVNGSPDAEQVANMATNMKFGEAAPTRDELRVEKEAGDVWRISSAAMTVQVREIANADFDNDGIEEILVFTAGAPEGGTASFYDAGLLEKDAADAVLAFTPLAFGRSGASGAGL